MAERPRVSPLPVNNDVLARIRPMSREDVPAVVDLHRTYIQGSLWARLGETFLRNIYLALLTEPHFRGYVYAEQDRVMGFIAGATDTRRMMRGVLRERPIRIAVAVLAGLARHPRFLARLPETIGYFRRSAAPEPADIPAESLFCCFEPDLRGKRISGIINKVLFDEFARLGHRYVKITTEAGNEGSRRQLTSWGFEQRGHFEFYGKEMILWVLDLAASERVESGRRT